MHATAAPGAQGGGRVMQGEGTTAVSRSGARATLARWAPNAPLGVSMPRSLALSLALFLVAPAALAQGGHEGHGHKPSRLEGVKAPNEKDLEALPADEKKRVKRLADVLARAAADEKAKKRSALLAELRQKTATSRKRSFEHTKALYGTDAPGKAEARKAAAAVVADVPPAALASSTVAWLADACDPTRELSLEVRYGVCAEAWEHEARAHPADWRVHYLWQEANAAVEQYDTAFTASWMVAELRPKDAAAWYQAAQLGLLADAPREATGAVHRGMQLEVDEMFLAGFAEALAKRGAVPTAVQLLENAIAKKPRSGRLLAMQALLLAGGGRPDLALPVAERASKTGYEGADLYLAWGHALLQQKREAEAIAKFRSAVALDPAASEDVPAAVRGKL